MPPPSPTPIQTASAEVVQRAEVTALVTVAVVVPEVELEAPGVEALGAGALEWWPLPQPAAITTSGKSTASLVTSGIVPYASVVLRRKEVRHD